MLSTQDTDVYQNKIGTPNVTIFDESLALDTSKKLSLFCSVSQQVITIAAADKRDMKFYALESYHFPKPQTDHQLNEKINSIREQSTIINKVKFDNVSVQLSNRLYTLVPETLFDKGDEKDFYSFNLEDKVETNILSEKINAFNTVNVFGYPKSIADSLKNVFISFQINHHVTSLLEGLRLQKNLSRHHVLNLNIQSGLIDIVVTEGKKLVLCNTFDYKSPEDALYYVLFVCEQLNLEPQEIKTAVFGDVEAQSAIYQLLQKYLKNISLGEAPSGLKFTYGFEKIPSHFYFSAFSHILCES